jgi:hypothetical protein
VSGKTVNYHTVPDDQLYAFLQKLAGNRAAGCVVEMHKGIREVGCECPPSSDSRQGEHKALMSPEIRADYGGDRLAESNTHLPRPARTFREALEAKPDLVQKVFGGEEQ